MSGRYRVDFPVDIGTAPGGSDDLEEAGRIYLAVPGVTDIYDTQEGRYLDPEGEIECVAAAYEAWHRASNREEWL